MAQSLANILLHLVFSTHRRQPWIDATVEEELHRVIGGACRDLGCNPHGVGGTSDHIHVACSLSRTVTVAELLEQVKKGSSKWIKTKGRQYADFAWQAGYGAFSVGQSQLDSLRGYIGRQREHHARQSFQDEFRALLDRYEIRYDERYVWE